jgi:hypothetical protein
VAPALRRAGFKGSLHVADQDQPLPPIRVTPASPVSPGSLAAVQSSTSRRLNLNRRRFAPVVASIPGHHLECVRGV